MSENSEHSLVQATENSPKANSDNSLNDTQDNDATLHYTNCDNSDNNADKKTFRCGWVALMGPPNAGKSTLLNTLLGQKLSIVTPKPQTTRNQIVGILTGKNSQIIFMDTPGLHHNRTQMRGQVGKIMREAIFQSIGMANVALLMLDSHLYINKPEFLERDILPVADIIRGGEKPALIVLNKIDLFHDKSRMLPLVEKVSELFPNAEVFPMSAQEKDGVGLLKKLIIQRLPEQNAQFPEDQISTARLRFLCAEMVREKVFEKLHQEVPYSTAVDIEKWEEFPKKNLTVIHAVIYIGRTSHKSMIIGKQGATIKDIGVQARKDIEELLDTRVHLELWVKVSESWMDDPNFNQHIDMYTL